MSHNDITGDKIATKAPTEAYRDGWEAIFGAACTRCGGAHALSECKWPLVAEHANRQASGALPIASPLPPAPAVEPIAPR